MAADQPVPGLRFAIVVSRYNDFVTDRLREGAMQVFAEAGVAPADVEVFEVPGAFELSLASKAVAATGRFAAVVALGCLIRGATPHFEYISSAVAHGLTDAAAATGVPIAFGVLTTDSAEQAIERADDGPGNKGREAAAAAIEMARLLRRLREAAPAPGLRV